MDKKILVHVGALLKNDRNQYLLLKRSSDSSWGSLQYDLPGGRMEWGEHPTETLDRELQEEIGGRSENLSFLGLRVLDAQVHESDYHVLALVYSGTFSGEVKLNEEHESFKWMTIEQIKELEDIEPTLKEFIMEKCAQ